TRSRPYIARARPHQAGGSNWASYFARVEGSQQRCEGCFGPKGMQNPVMVQGTVGITPPEAPRAFPHGALLFLARSIASEGILRGHVRGERGAREDLAARRRRRREAVRGRRKRAGLGPRSSLRH